MRLEKAHKGVLTAMIPRGWRCWVVQEQVDEGSREDVTTRAGIVEDDRILRTRYP